ncbi:MAG TPA: phosphoribosyltransferase family protein, partial [Kofleriaceae bacterium]|nr:phosphoribosyltransferase family protein [Kofleriaceae bacterium]
SARGARGHFPYESGHHGDLWLDLGALFQDARRAHEWAARLAEAAASCRPDFVCGPLAGGAFLAQSMAAHLGAGFVFAERLAGPDKVSYRVPPSLRGALDGVRILLVDDAINAGSALLSTLDDLGACGAELAGIACLMTLGEAASEIAARRGVPFTALASVERGMWTPAECPLCRAGAPLVEPDAR